MAVLLLLNILGTALLGVGLLATVPLSALTMTSVYRQLNDLTLHGVSPDLGLSRLG
jgi:uncharacterized membrane protein